MRSVNRIKQTIDINIVVPCRVVIFVHQLLVFYVHVVNVIHILIQRKIHTKIIRGKLIRPTTLSLR